MFQSIADHRIFSNEVGNLVYTTSQPKLDINQLKINAMQKFILLLMLAIGVMSCEKYDEDVLGITGLYDANIIGWSGPHTISVAYDRGDEIIIEAPFDGFVWGEASADVDDQGDEVKRIQIYDQEIGPGVFIYGEGSYFNGTLQLDYTLDFGVEIIDYRLLGSQFP